MNCVPSAEEADVPGEEVAVDLRTLPLPQDTHLYREPCHNQGCRSGWILRGSGSNPLDRKRIPP